MFEKGEVDYSFYLFTGGRDWDGSNQCLETKLVSDELGTPNGLRLGLSPSQVSGILGRPDSVTGNRFVYFRQVLEPTPTADLLEWRKMYPEMNDEEFHQNYDFYSLSVYIEARFGSSNVNYLVVSKLEVY